MDAKKSPRAFHIPWTTLLLTAFSIIYFADSCLRASEKYFWFDELFTVYICRMPNLSSIWNALLAGLDFNPPLFFLITKASQTVFGPGLVGTRMPEIIGFWIASICLFRFASRRGGLVAGFIAMGLPMLTGAYFYAYEARPHALVLAFCALASVCWQAYNDKPKLRWLVGLSVSLFAASMTHCYALVAVVPFVLAELFRGFRSKRILWARWVALAAPAAAIPFYLPLLAAYKKTTAGTGFESIFPATWMQFADFYLFVFGSFLLIFVCLFLALVVDAAYSRPPANTSLIQRTVDPVEAVLVIGFVALPAIGVIFAKAVHGPFFHRYFLSALIGFVVAISLGFSAAKGKVRIGMILALIVGFAILRQFTFLAWHRYNGWGEHLNEPSSHIVLNTAPGHPLGTHSLLLDAPDKSLAIGTPFNVDFLYLLHYAPELASRLYMISPSPLYFEYHSLRVNGAPLGIDIGHILTYEQFFSAHPHALFYCDRLLTDRFLTLMEFGAKIKAVQNDGTHILAETAP